MRRGDRPVALGTVTRTTPGADRERGPLTESPRRRAVAERRLGVDRVKGPVSGLWLDPGLPVTALSVPFTGC